MDRQQNSGSVTAVVPAFNEAERIGKVLEVLTSYPGFAEVIVVDDGSSDGTGEIATKYDVRYIRNETNRGKGHSMDRGVEAARTNLIFFCDADITGLRHEHIDEILKPVERGEVDMSIAARDRTGNMLPFAADFFPVGGERAVTKSLWKRVPVWFKSNFRIETGLNLYAKCFGKGLRTKMIKGLVQTMKEKKYGIIEGAIQRWRLNIDLLEAMWRLLFVDSFRLLKKGVINTEFFLGFWAKNLVRNLIISVALIGSWPVFVAISPFTSGRRA